MLETYHSCALLQLVFLFSVLVIFLRIPFLGHLEPQIAKQEEPPPADRLVVFVRDGLPAQNFLANRCRNVPLLQNIFLHEGRMGIIRPEQMTYSSLSPYVSLFTGFNENAASVVHGWFGDYSLDSIFSRSNLSYAWGAREVLRRFPGIDHPQVVDIRSNDRVTVSCSQYEQAIRYAMELSLPVENKNLQNVRGLLLLVHLTSVKSSCESLENIEKIVHSIYRRFEKTFPDNRTAYILTSNVGKTASKRECKLSADSPFLIWGSGVKFVNSTNGRSFAANSSGHRLPLDILSPPQVTALMSALLGIPPPIHNRGILPRGILNISLNYEANAFLTNAKQLAAQARRLRELHPSKLPAYWLDLVIIDRFLNNSKRLKSQKRYKALRDYTYHFMPLLIKGIDYYEDYFRVILLVAVLLAAKVWLFSLLYHLASRLGAKVDFENLDRARSRTLMWCRGYSRVLTFLAVVYMLLDGFPYLVMAILLLPLIYFMITLKVIEKRPNMNFWRRLFFPALLSLVCLEGFVMRSIMALAYLSFAIHANRNAFLIRGPQLYIWLLLLVGLAVISTQPESLGYSNMNAQRLSIVITLLRPWICGNYINLVTWLINALVMVIAFEYSLVAWHPQTTCFLCWIYLGYVAFRHRRNLPSGEMMCFNLCTLYTLTCTSYESVVIQMLALELQMGLRMKLERNESIDPKTTAQYILVYCWYSLFVIGSFPAFDDYLEVLHATSFGYLSQTYGLVMGLKLLLPWLVMVCILVAHFRDIRLQERTVFMWLMCMCNFMSLGLILRVRGNGPWREMLARFGEFAAVQLFPFTYLGLWRCAHLKVGSKWRTQLPESLWSL
ncbi:hypothetical protein KR018_011012 [Drosophila ironensis]|nr:hypothetical protein KR018_011012 [Drosophila ironensis]